MKIALAQINTRMGDVEGNFAGIKDCAERARQLGAELVVFPELSVPGYPPHDYLERTAFVAVCEDALLRIADVARGMGILVGAVQRNETGPGKPIFNSACLALDGSIVAVQHKSLIPTYDIFDESRYFEPARARAVMNFRNRKLGVSICEDIWNDKSVPEATFYACDPVAELVDAGAEILINLSASPFSVGRNRVRRSVLGAAARRHSRPLFYVNLVGGNDSLIFSGKSMVFSPDGDLAYQCKSFEEDLVVLDSDSLKPPVEFPDADDIQDLHNALILGLRDYARKCGFRTAVLGLSGGIDSSVVACIAADALGARNVYGVSMPSVYSSQGSKDDARTLADNLGINYLVMPIESPRAVFNDLLKDAFAGRGPDVTEENIQARIRGVIIMALSNKFGHLPLATGNKSELAMGYSTLYGDMCGGLTVIGDVPKTMVYRLARHINRHAPVIPEPVFTKPPSAELRPNQTDQDTLPPYEMLDEILAIYIENHCEEKEIIAAGYAPALVRDVLRRVDRSEYKRRQAAPILRVTTKAFGSGRRLPIAQGWR